jgi:adenosylmethionine-8-amino-7-oxononanoate aminotransferase
VWLHAADQKRLLDGTSSWWVNTIGHGRREIATAIARQQRRLDHTMFAGLTHQPASRLAQRLADWTGLSRVFYSDNGSTAVEVALKIAYQSWVNRGETNRRSFLALNGNYHGDTFGCMSIAATSGFHDAFGPLLFQAKYLNPCTRHPSSIGQTDVSSSIASMKQYLAEHASTLAAIIIEPLVQGAGGMLMHDLGWLKALCLEARSHHIPVIFDEVFVGFGRLGTWFAFEQINFKPDILCLAKGLTGGNLALAVTLTSETFFEHFLSDAKSKALLHGHSYTANPIACAAALATCNIYASEGLLENVKQLEHCYVEWLEAYPTLLSHPRIHGSILAGEFPGSGTGDYFKNTQSGYSKTCLDNGLYVRPLGNTAYLVPPLVINHAETQHMLAAFTSALARN